MESKVYKEGVAHEIKDIVEDQMTAKIQKLGDANIDINKPGAIKRTLKHYRAQSLTAETMLNRIDQDEAMGVHNQFVVRPLAESANREFRLLRYYQMAMLKAAGDLSVREMEKKVDNTFWRDPVSGDLYDLRKRNVLGML